MKIFIPRDFLLAIKGKHLLLDTNFFIDASNHKKQFERLVKAFLENDATLVSIEPVQTEFLKGSPSENKYKIKVEYFEEIISNFIPITKDIFDNVRELTKMYKEEGKGVSIVDLLLGATLIKYQKNLCLITKDIKDFPTNIFRRLTHFNLLDRRSIQSYGVYDYGQMTDKTGIKEDDIPF